MKPRMAAGVLIRDTDDNVLLVKPTYKDGWDIPGGYVEPGESPAQACSRELVEELGLRSPVGRLLVVDWAPHPDEGDKVLWIFDGGTMETASLERLALEASEIAEARFWPTESFDSLMPERLARRLHLAVSALDSHLTLYAEHGAMPARRATL